MATRYFYWRGAGAGTKTDWQDGRNWVNSAGNAYPAGDYPSSSSGDSDHAVFDTALAVGAASPETTLDLSAKTALITLRATAAYTGHIGGEASPLIAKISGEAVIDQSGSVDTSYVSGETAAGIAVIKILGGNIALGGRFAAVEIFRGNVSILAAANIANRLLVNYLTSSGDVALTIAAGAELPATITVNGGSTACAAAIETLDIRGGSWEQSANLTAVNISSGSLVWKRGNITTANIYSGSLSGSPGTEARSIGTAVVYPAGIINLNNGQNNITVVNHVQTYGGSLILGSGQKITILQG